MKYVLLILFLVVLTIFLINSNITGFFVRDSLSSVKCQDCNIIFITIDTLRADHLSSYGYFQQTSPNIDLLASESIMFTNAFSQIPHTPPSHWSMFTGLYPFNHNKYSPADNATDLLTLPEILKSNDYITSAFVSSEILRKFNNKFDYFNGFNNQTRYERFDQKIASETTDQALDWLESNYKEKFMLWIHYYDPHSPYDPPDSYDIYNYSDEEYYSDPLYSRKGLSNKRPLREDIANYDGEIRFVDHSVGVLLKNVKDLGLSENTIIILLSDHGECFGEHNFSDFGYDDERPCVFHGKTLYDQEIHIPLILKIPDQSPKIVEHIVETVDIVPTLLNLLGIPEINSDGENMLSQSIDQYTFSMKKPGKQRSLAISIRDTEWKFITTRPSRINLEQDIKEQQGLPVEEQEYQEEFQIKKFLFNVLTGEYKNYLHIEPDLSIRMESFLKGIFSDEGFVPETVDKETEKLLKSLGYIE